MRTVRSLIIAWWMFLHGVAPASAYDTVDPSTLFTKEEVEAAYALGHADAVRDAVAATPAARSMGAKMKPAPAKTNSSPIQKKP